MGYVVIGDRLAVGRAVVQQLLEMGKSVRVLPHRAEAGELHAVDTKVWQADLNASENLVMAMHGIEALAIITPGCLLREDKAHEVIAAARRAGVRRIVSVSAYGADRVPHLPCFSAHLNMRQLLYESRVPFTTIMANHVFQTDLLYREAIFEGHCYPEPIGNIGVNRVDARDVAEAVVSALTEAGHEWASYPLVGIEALRGADLAEIYSYYAGVDIRYGGDDLDRWTEMASPFFSSEGLRDMAAWYRLVQQRGLRARERDFERQAEILHHQPRSFHTFVRESIARWSNRSMLAAVGRRG